MKILNKTNLILLSAVIATIGLLAFTPQKYSFVPDSKITITGTSSMHDWDCSTNTIEGEITTPEAWSTNQKPKVGDKITQGEIRIPVKSIESGKKTMNKKMYEALKADKFPKIIYKLQRAEVISVENVNLGIFKIQTNGLLTVAGVTKEIQTEAKGQLLQNGKLCFTGTKELKMSDFNIDPPSALLGTLKTGDEVMIHFELTVNK